MTGAGATLSTHGLVRSWLLWTTSAEFVGFFVPATVAAPTLGGLVMATVVAAVTGLGLRALLSTATS